MNITAMPDPNELYQQAFSLHRSGSIVEAIVIYRQLLKQYPENARVLYLLGTAEAQRGNFLESLDLFDKSINISTNSPEVHNEQGIVFKKLKRFDDALQSYNRAIQLNPNHPVLHINRGTTLIELKRFDEALQSLDHSIQLNPGYPEAHVNRGIALKELKRIDEALQSYDRALQLNPDNLAAHINRGTALIKLKRFDEALQSLDHAIRLNPDSPETHYNRGIALKELKRIDEALRSFECAIQLKPDEDSWLGNCLATELMCCDWHNYDTNKNKILNSIINMRVTDPFLALLLIDSPDIQRQSARILVKTCFVASTTNMLIKYPSHDKIRLGYFSADYCNHPTLHLIAEMFEKHDRSRYELNAFSFGPESNDPWRKRTQKCFDRFLDVRFMPDHDVTMLARAHQIDIAIDLMGHTADSRPNIFAGRAAPVQVNYLGYPGTMGAGFMDYIVADKTIIPESGRHHFTEKVIYLPDCYQANCHNLDISQRVLTRTELRLPQDGFVFCCFNNNNKITPTMFDSWMRILRHVDESVLWLYVSNKWAEYNLRMEAEKRGMSGERLVFAVKVPIDEHLNRIRHADLFLDTLPCNAHTTASDALRMGVPLVTQAGNAFAGRVAASLLNALDLEELITYSSEEYEKIAVDLVTDPDRLQAIKEKLNANVQTSSLFDSERFTRHMEKAYELMYERYRSDLDPDHIVV